MSGSHYGSAFSTRWGTHWSRLTCSKCKDSWARRTKPEVGDVVRVGMLQRGGSQLTGPWSMATKPWSLQQDPEHSLQQVAAQYITTDESLVTILLRTLNESRGKIVADN